MDIEEQLDELEESFDATQEEFQDAKDGKASNEVTEKEEDAEELIQEIKGQIEFLKEQVAEQNEE